MGSLALASASSVAMGTMPAKYTRDLMREGLTRVVPVAGAVMRGVSQTARHLFRTEVLQPHVCVFMVGLPAAGKSTVIDSRYGRFQERHTMTVVDLDAEMVAHPNYDPADPDSIYRSSDAYHWADGRAEERFQNSLADSSLARVIVDGTGTNVKRQVRRMREARKAGWFVKVLYVRVPVRTAIDRAKLRKRKVSPERIMHYQNQISAALKVASKYADEVETVDHSFDMAEHVCQFNNDISIICGS